MLGTLGLFICLDFLNNLIGNLISKLIQTVNIVCDISGIVTNNRRLVVCKECVEGGLFFACKRSDSDFSVIKLAGDNGNCRSGIDCTAAIRSAASQSTRCSAQKNADRATEKTDKRTDNNTR